MAAASTTIMPTATRDLARPDFHPNPPATTSMDHRAPTRLTPFDSVDPGLDSCLPIGGIPCVRQPARARPARSTGT
jgi:hypothetical protein